jgi:hypothetical protein
MNRHLVAESFNYDYLPGEPESRRAWFITLRFYPPNDLVRGMILEFDTSKSNGKWGKYLTSSKYYRVIDIHGRHIVVEPVDNTIPKNCELLNGTSRRCSYSGNLQSMGVDNIYGSFIYNPNNANETVLYPRTGRYFHEPRPLIQQPSTYSKVSYRPHFVVLFPNYDKT